MSELAFNLNGERFELPATAAYWRVRRMKDVPRGGPEVVFGRDGLPLVIPIDTSTEEFRHVVEEVSGRYRLDPLDDCQQPVPDTAAAYVQVAKGERNSAGAATPAADGPRLDPRDELLREVIRTNADVSKTMAEKFAGVMEAAAVLLKAADGAGLPARPGMAVVDGVDDDEDDQGEEPAARSSFDLGAVLGQLVPALCLALGSRGGADAQKAAAALGQAARALPAGDAEPKPVAPQTSGVTKKGDARNESSKAVVEAPAVAATPADAMAHFLAIQNQLSLDERAFVQGVISDLTLADLGAWREQLTRLSVDDAVALIRGEIAKSKEKAS